MASKRKSQPDQEEDGKIPVFTVLKNGAILKNIFIVNKPPEPAPSPLPNPKTVPSLHDHEDILIVGRHPDCNIMVTHPSISRFHLQIHSKPSSQKLSVIDLSSVHGTWVSDRKLEPGVGVELKEGDTLKIGGSSRIYRLHWIPISCAYDLENPFISELDVAMAAEKEEEDAAVEEGKIETVQNVDFCAVDDEEMQSADSVMESVGSLFPDENLEVTVGKDISSATSMPEDVILSFDEGKSSAKDNDHPERKTFELSCGPFKSEISSLHLTYEVENNGDAKNLALSPLHVEPTLQCDSSKSSLKIPEKFYSILVDLKSQSHVEEENGAYPATENPQKTEVSSTSIEYLMKSSSLPVVEAVQETNMRQADEIQGPPDSFTSQLLPSATADVEVPTGNEFGYTFEKTEKVKDISTEAKDPVTEYICLPVEEANFDTRFQQVPFFKEQAARDSLSDGEEPDKDCKELKLKLPAPLNMKACHEEGLSMVEFFQEINDCWCLDSLFPISFPIESVNSSMPEEAALEIASRESPQSLIAMSGRSETCVEAKEKNSTFGSIWSRRGEAASAPRIQTSKSQIKSTVGADTKVDACNENGSVNKSISKDLSSVLDGKEEEIITPDKENFSPNTLQMQFPKNNGKLEEVFTPGRLEEMNKSISKDLSSVLDGEEDEIFTPDKENLSLNALQMQVLKNSSKPEEIKCSKSRRSHNSKSNCAPYPVDKSLSKDFSPVLDGEEEEIFTPDKENISPNTLQMQFLKNKAKLEEVFTPDKRNFSPNTLQMRVLNNMGKLEEIKCSKSNRSHNSKVNCAPGIYPDESMSPTSNKENQTPKVALGKSARRPFGSQIKSEQKQGTMSLKNRVERVPFQSLLVNSGDKSRSEISSPVSAVKSVNADDYGQILDKHPNPSHSGRQQKRNWDMIVDTASLLGREPRKALQLLQGLKGTRLIIPRMVTKELDSMKHQFSIFRRRSEASLALGWIEECMTKTKWWIHVQSTMEEGMLIAPTPPASPLTQFSKDSWTFPYGDGISQPLPSSKSLMEIVSPTADDHILDFALLHRRKQKDGQLVLLSDDVTLKIKSMAEGLLCETVQEFRQSLVNPFSERFLWVNSSPRGLTWSCQDDVVLREKYSDFPSKKPVKGEGARGLKLILLHNSHYGLTNSAR